MRTEASSLPLLNFDIAPRSVDNTLSIDGLSILPTIQLAFGDSAPQTVLIDLGSSLTWASGTRTNSSSIDLSNEAVRIDYSGASVTGVYATDVVRLANIFAPAKFGFANQDVNPDLFAGLLGLSNGPQPTIMGALKDTGAIDHSIATLSIPHKGEAGTLAIGSNTADGDVKMLRSLDDHLWSVEVSNATVDGLPMHLGSRKAVIDSGNAVFAVGADDAAAINKALNATGMAESRYVIPCSIEKPLVISIDDQEVTIGPHDYIGEAVGNGGCISLIDPAATIGFDWNLGVPFLANTKLVIDNDSNSVGFGVIYKGGHGSFGKPVRGGGGTSDATTSMPSPGSLHAWAFALICTLWLWRRW